MASTSEKAYERAYRLRRCGIVKFYEPLVTVYSASQLTPGGWHADHYHESQTRVLPVQKERTAMSQPNPFEMPESPEVFGVSSDKLIKRAQLLLVYRDHPGGPDLWFYLGQSLTGHLLHLLLYAIVVGLFIDMDQRIAALGLACFFFGAKVRDLRWYHGLAKDWPIGSQFVDWAKAERLAQASSSKTGAKAG